MSSDIRWTPVPARTFVEGDITTMLAALTSSGSEHQEMEGQRWFIASTTLPRKCLYCTREHVEAAGIVFLDDVDDLFVNVKLPDGWEKIPTEHFMWSRLVDKEGRERAAIFYKAAFHDRDAHVSLTPRFSYTSKPYDNDYGNKNAFWICVILDAGRTMYTIGTQEPRPNYGDDREILAWVDTKSVLYSQAREWLNKNYPDWQNPLAYWD